MGMSINRCIWGGGYSDPIFALRDLVDVCRELLVSP